VNNEILRLSVQETAANVILLGNRSFGCLHSVFPNPSYIEFIGEDKKLTSKKEVTVPWVREGDEKCGTI
jgi:hypothetical protein